MASKRFRALSALALIGAAITIGSVARAEPTAAEKETARQLMTDGREKRDKHDLQAALKSFQAADGIMHVPTTGYEVAVTQAEMGLLVEARDTLLRVLRIPEEKNEPAPFKDARKKAQAMSDALEERIPSLKITLSGAPEGSKPQVTIDGVELSQAALGLPYKVNPGHHVVAAKTDKAAGEATVDVSEKETKPVEVTLKPTETTATETTEAEEKPEEKPVPPPPPPSRGLGTVTWIGFGVAAAGIVAGTVTGLLSMSSTSSAQNGCRNNQCPPSTWNDLDSANSMATISTISFIVAGVGAGVGVVGLLTRPKAEAAPQKDTAARVTPWIGLGSAGVRGTF